MRLQSATALILDVFDLQEKDRIVSFLSAEHGKRRGVARGARTKYSRFAGQLQPLAKVDVTWFERDDRDLVRIGEVGLVRPATALGGDLERILLGAYLADHMMAFAQENEASGPLFRLLDSTLEALLAGVDPGLAARYYEVWMLRLAGIFPPPYLCPGCGDELGRRAFLVEHDSALVCADCATGPSGRRPSPEDAVSAPVLEFLRSSARTSLGDMAGTPTSRQALDGVETLCGRIRRGFLGEELKSYGVLKRTLGSCGPATA